jgi:hypothetical protein
MTLTSLLEINRKFLEYDDERALSIAERRWRERGSPREPEALCEALEDILTHFTEEGIYYPKILLLRKKQLQRGTWKPKNKPAASQRRTTPGDDPVCPDCAGTGIWVMPAGAGSFCTCEAGEALKNGFCKKR